MSIAGIFKAAGVAMLGAGGKMVAEKFIEAAAESVVDTSLRKAIQVITQQWARGAGGNYVTASKSVRVEPFALVDSRVSRLPYAKDVMNAAQRLFAAHYMLSVAADNTIAGVKVSKRLDKFAPDRDLSQATMSFLSNESYQFGLPFPGKPLGLERYNVYSPESRPVIELSNEALDDQSTQNGSTAFASSTAKIINDVGNLTVGQIVDVTISDGDSKGVIPVMIRLKTIGMDPSVLVEILSLGGEDKSLGGRYRRVKVGELSAFADLIAVRDQVRRYRSAAMKDTSGYFRKVHARANRSSLATLLTGTPSIGQASSICVISTDTKRELEDNISGRLDDFQTRQNIFEDSLLMLLLVVDDDHETVTIYTQDIEDYGVYPLKDIKGAGSTPQSNGDLSDIMRSYLEGKVPGRL